MNEKKFGWSQGKSESIRARSSEHEVERKDTKLHLLRNITV